MYEIDDASSKDPTVIKANSLIQAGYRLTLAEQRVMLSAISQIGKKDEPMDQTTYSVSADALSDIGGVSRRRAYQTLSEAAYRLYKREVRIEHGPNGNKDGPRGRITMTRWVQEVDYIQDEGRIEIRFAHSILPYLTLLKREFTSYRLRHVATMRSTHGIRLYELLQQWRQIGEREFSLKDLRHMFGVTDMYPNIRDLKRRVIVPAVKDVNECSDLTVEWGQRKAGRRVVAIQFKFQPKKKTRQEKSVNKPAPQQHLGPRFDHAAHERSKRESQTVEARQAGAKALAEIKRRQQEANDDDMADRAELENRGQQRLFGDDNPS